jgi:hypothetical protein
MGWWTGMWDSAPRSGGWEWVDPRKVKLDHRASNRDAVKFYERNPNGKYDSRSGDPYVNRNGVVMNGNHRMQAAKNRGRKVRAWVER